MSGTAALGADIARGTLTGNAQRNADGSWQVENLRMADIRLQSEKSLTDFFAPLRSVPSLQIGRLEVIDARLQGPDWAVTDLDLSLRNMTFSFEVTHICKIFIMHLSSKDTRLQYNTQEFCLF